MPNDELKTRIADQISKDGSSIIEVKNKARITRNDLNQIRDAVKHVNNSGLPGLVRVVIDNRTKISRELLRMHLDPGNPVKIEVHDLTRGQT